MATNFLDAAGTNGYIATPFDLLTTELNTLGNGNTALSSVGGSSGTFSQSNIANAIFGEIWFKSGGAFTPTTGGVLSGWFIRSGDGGSTFEKTVSNTALARAPDFVIPLFVSAYASADLSWASGGYVKLPWGSFKVLLQNNSGAALPASGNEILCGPVAVQY